MNKWLEYSRRKLAWMEANPTATAAEYDAAIRRIIDELEV